MEDSNLDAELLAEELRRGGFEPAWKRVDTAAALSAALDGQRWDIITCDWVMPQFSGPAALALLRERQVDVPIIVVSGQVGEEYAVTAMKAGAHDFVSKHNLARLVSAVERELREAEERRARKRAEAAVRLLAAIVESSNDAVIGKTLEGIITSWNPAAQRIFGYTAEEVIGRSIDTIVPANHRAELPAALDRIKRGEPVAHFETVRVCKDGRLVDVSLTVSPVSDERGRIAGVSTIARDISDRKRAEEALRWSEERYRSLVVATAQVVWTTNAEGEVEDMPMWRAFTGQNEKQVRGFGWLDALHPDDREGTAAAWLRSVQTRAPYETEYRVRRHDGAYRVVAARGVPVLQADGRIREWVGICTDITERQRAEQEKEQYLKFFLLSADAMCIADPFGCFKHVNPALLRMIGYSESELISKPFLDLVVPEDRQRTAGEMEMQFMTRPSMNFENRYVHKDGTTVLLSWNAYFDKNDRVTYATARDISERRRVEVALADSERRLRTHIEATPVAVIEWDAAYRVTSWNPAAEQIFGYTADEAMGTHASLIIPEATRSLVYEIFRELFEGHGGRRSTNENLTKSRSTIICEWVNTPLTSADGSVLGVASLAQEVTERARAQEALRRLNRELEQRVLDRTAQLEATNKELESFSYSVSHDLRAPLRVVDGFTKMMLERCEGRLDAEGRHYLQMVREGAEHMEQLIHDLLGLSRLTRSEMHWQAVDLSALARAIAAELQKAQPERLVEFVIADGVVLNGDPGLLRVALQNLLGNAWKYTSKHPAARIEFGSMTQDGQPVYFVRDDGAGFDMTSVDKLFGAFQRLHAADEFEGTGIGLATVQRIINRHSGRIWAHGAVEQGATFYFTVGRGAIR